MDDLQILFILDPTIYKLILLFLYVTLHILLMQHQKIQNSNINYLNDNNF